MPINDNRQNQAKKGDDPTGRYIIIKQRVETGTTSSELTRLARIEKNKGDGKFTARFASTNKMRKGSTFEIDKSDVERFATDDEVVLAEQES